MNAWWMVAVLGCGMPPEGHARIDALEARVAGLEARLSDLEDEWKSRPNDMEAIRARHEARMERLAELRAQRAAEKASGGPATVLDALTDLESFRTSARVRQVRGGGEDGDVTGFQVDEIRRGSVPDRLGFRNGDVVVRVNGHELRSNEDLNEAAAKAATAERIEVVYARDGELHTMSFGLTDPLPPAEEPFAVNSVDMTVRQLLADREALSRQGRALLHRSAEGEYDGYRLSALRFQSPLDLLGFKNGDVVHEVAGMPVTSMQEVEAAYAAIQELDRFDVVVGRRGERLVLTIEADTVVPVGP